MMTLRMSFRNLFRHRRRTVLTGLSILAGFTLASIFIGWADGAYNGIIDSFTRDRLGHIQIHAAGYLDRPGLQKTLNDPGRIETVLETESGIVAWAPRLYAAGLVAVGEKSAGAAIIGLDPDRESRLTRFDAKIIAGRTLASRPSHEAVLGKGLAEIMKAGPGDEAVILSQGADGSIANDLYTVVGIHSGGDDATDRASFYLHLADAQEVLALDRRVHEIALNVDNLKNARRIAVDLGRRLGDPGLDVSPWQVFAASFYRAMKADKEGMWIMLVVIVIIVAVGVLNTVLMSVLERRREYGLLKALGTRPGRIVALVLTEVVILALVCVAVGTGLGLAANGYLAGHGLHLGRGFSYGGITFTAMKSEINLRSFLIPLITVIVCAVVVGLIPALRAARTDAARSMRQH
ncbi:MAG: ABC transporter permease [Candidatus Aminicenantes bacterium]|nr:ABC transporter permease [Candidatus Aminicenantes bacterium]